MKPLLFIYGLTVGLVGSLVIFSGISAVNLGQEYLNKGREAAGYEAATQTTFAKNMGVLVKTVLSFVGIIFLALMVYAGFLWMTARGAEDQITKAQDIIRAAIIGIVITLGAYSITDFVVNAVIDKTT